MLARMRRKKALPYKHPESLLQNSLTGFDLCFMGIGAIIGAGVFVLTGVAAATKAGPGIVLSYVIAGFASLLAALAYAELAASLGGTGSAYHYAYTSFGEFMAWIIGWDLLLEYVMSVSTVAIGWSGYVNNLLQALHIHLPDVLLKNPYEGGAINLLASGIILLMALLLSLGVKLSARINTAIVFIKLLTIIVFIMVAAHHVQLKYWENFLPFGWTGVANGAAIVFFAYIGFDALATAAEETIHPERDIPFGIISALIICTLVYILVAALLTSIVPYQTLNVQSPVADALLKLGYRTIAGFIAAGAIAGLTTVILVMYYGLTRILLAITRDGLLPKNLGVVNHHTHTPIRIILLTGIIMALIAGFTPIDHAAQLVNIGTLAAFAFVCSSVPILRRTQPNLLRPFRLPWNPITPLLGTAFCFYLMCHLPLITWLRFIIWAIVGLIIYFTYSQKRAASKDFL